MQRMPSRRDIQTCRDHHAVLRELLERFAQPAVDDGPAVRTGLRQLETVLLRHLAFEDSQLYPALENVTDGAVAIKARRYREEMGGLSAQVVAFLARWTVDGAVETEPSAFAREWETVRSALERRMSAEDDDLYEVAERLAP